MSIFAGSKHWGVTAFAIAVVFALSAIFLSGCATPKPETYKMTSVFSCDKKKVFKANGTTVTMIQKGNDVTLEIEE